MSTEKTLLVGLLVVIVITGIAIGVSVLSMPQENTQNKGGQDSSLAPDIDLIDQERMVPDWEFEMSDGSSLAIRDLIGKWVIVDLMSTSCPACEAENDELKEIYRDHSDSIVILSLSVDSSSTPDIMAQYKESRDIPWDVGLDDNGFFVQYFRVRYTPTLVIIDDQGYFRMYHEGLWTADDIMQAMSLM